MDEDILKEPLGIDYSKSYTYGDYLQFELEEMVELIRGKIFRMSPAPSVKHQEVSMNLARLFSNYFLKKSCKVYHAPIDVVLPIPNTKKDKSTTVIQPDLCVVCDQSKIEELCIFGAPDLIIEILSPQTRKKDIQLKYDIYEEVGVSEYWIVMPEEKLVEVFVLQSGKYQRINTYTDTDIVPCQIFEGLEVDLNDVFV